MNLFLMALFVSYNSAKIETAYISKYNSDREYEAILLMITDNNKKWHYLAVKSLSVLLRGVTSTNNEDFYCLNCLHSYRTENKLKQHENVCENHD